MSVLIFLFGTIIGSFLNVVILRLPAGESLGGYSRCPRCGTELGPHELVPIFSFLWQRGKCQACGKPISPRYAIIELITGLLFAGAWVLMGPATPFEYLEFARVIVLLALLVVIFIVDLEHYLILDSVLLTGGILLLGLNIALDSVGGGQFFTLSSSTFGGMIAGIAAAAPLFVLWFISQGRWIGFGDVKFLVFLGIALGWPEIWICWFGAFFLGSVVSVGLLVFGLKTWGSKLPFGTFLSVAAAGALIWGDIIIAWYLSFLGF